jgi:hypothetical protein
VLVGGRCEEEELDSKMPVVKAEEPIRPPSRNPLNLPPAHGHEVGKEVNEHGLVQHSLACTSKNQWPAAGVGVKTPVDYEDG